MTTPDDRGRLPLHTALQDNVRLGSIKLLVKGNPAALHFPDNNLALPLHIACQHHHSVRVVQYMLSLDEAALDAVDKAGNTVLHYACRGAKYDTIALLLEKYDAASVSKRNNNGKFPIELLWERLNSAEHRRDFFIGSLVNLLLPAFNFSCSWAGRSEDIMQVETVFQLLRAFPEMFPSAFRH